MWGKKREKSRLKSKGINIHLYLGGKPGIQVHFWKQHNIKIFNQGL